MKFRSFREFRQGPRADVAKYLAVDLTSTFRDLFAGLTKLTFEDNFESFETEVTIGAGSEELIPNRLDTVPTRRIFLRHSGDPGVVDGDTEWDLNFVSLKNVGSSSATLTVVFMR